MVTLLYEMGHYFLDTQYRHTYPFIIDLQKKWQAPNLEKFYIEFSNSKIENLISQIVKFCLCV